MEKGLNSIAESLSDELSMFSQHLPILRHLAKYLEMQNLFLSNHAEVLAEITKMVEQAPKRLRCAYDVPSFGSISAEREYRICCDAFDTYVAREEWSLSIMLLPADVGVNIVNTEFKALQKRRQAWVEDIHALRRFQGYEQRSGQRGKRKFKLGWLAVNRDANGMPLGLHSMPFNLWIANEEQAVFSTVIDNYRPTSTNLTDTAGSQVQEIGFSTRNPDMVRFLIEIMEKYSQNVDEGVTLEAQIAASEAVKAKIERSIEKGMS
jgi:hypothetical protein